MASLEARLAMRVDDFLEAEITVRFALIQRLRDKLPGAVASITDLLDEDQIRILSREREELVIGLLTLRGFGLGKHTLYAAERQLVTAMLLERLYAPPGKLVPWTAGLAQHLSPSRVASMIIQARTSAHMPTDLEWQDVPEGERSFICWMMGMAPRSVPRDEPLDWLLEASAKIVLVYEETLEKVPTLRPEDIKAGELA